MSDETTNNEPDWWFDGLCGNRHGFDRSVPGRVPPGEPTRLWLMGWDDAQQECEGQVEE